jgi:hypothetical protein
MSVDLPAPFSPSSATISARPTCMETLFSARVPPNCLDTPRTASSGSATSCDGIMLAAAWLTWTPLRRHSLADRRQQTAP